MPRSVANRRLNAPAPTHAQCLVLMLILMPMLMLMFMLNQFFKKIVSAEYIDTMLHCIYASCWRYQSRVSGKHCSCHVPVGMAPSSCSSSFRKKLYWLSISSPCYIVYMFHVGDISPVCQANIVVATCQLGWLPVQCQLGWLPVQKTTQKTYTYCKLILNSELIKSDYEK